MCGVLPPDGGGRGHDGSVGQSPCRGTPVVMAGVPGNRPSGETPMADSPLTRLPAHDTAGTGSLNVVIETPRGHRNMDEPAFPGCLVRPLQSGLSPPQRPAGQSRACLQAGRRPPRPNRRSAGCLLAGTSPHSAATALAKYRVMLSANSGCRVPRRNHQRPAPAGEDEPPVPEQRRDRWGVADPRQTEHRSGRENCEQPDLSNRQTDQPRASHAFRLFPQAMRRWLGQFHQQGTAVTGPGCPTPSSCSSPEP